MVKKIFDNHLSHTIFFLPIFIVKLYLTITECILLQFKPCHKFQIYPSDSKNIANLFMVKKFFYNTFKPCRNYFIFANFTLIIDAYMQVMQLQFQPLLSIYLLWSNEILTNLP